MAQDLSRLSSLLLAQEGAAAAPTGAAPAEAAPTAAAPETTETKDGLSGFFESLVWSGYIETSYTFNTQGPHSEDIPADEKENALRVFDIESNEFMLNAVELDILRAANEDQILGFRLTPFAGDDASAIHSVGLFEDDDFDLVNANIQICLPGDVPVLDGSLITIGKFVTTAGAEVIEAPKNDNFSRSFLFGFAIPFTHTGLKIEKTVIEDDKGTCLLAMNGGIVNGWDNVDDENEAKTFFTGATVTPCKSFSTTANLFYGWEQPDNDSDSRTLLDIVSTINIDDNTKLLLNFDWGGEEGGGYAEWWGFSGIARHNFALCGDDRNWFVALRGEYMNDNDGGTRLGTETRVYEVTGTLGAVFWKHLLMRWEIRYDKADEDVFFSDSSDGVGADENHQVTLAMETALTWG